MLSDRMLPTTTRFSTRPLYLQLRDALAERIAQGEWKPGTAIPNESDLAREFGVSSGTMRKALDMMEGEHLLTRRQGRGTFVNDQASDAMALRFSNIRDRSGERVTGRVKTSEISEGKATDKERDRLALQPNEAVYRVRRVRLHNDRPFMVEETSFPAALFPGLTGMKSPSHRITVLAQEYGLLLGKAEERISIGRAQPAVAADLGIAPDSSLLVVDRVVHGLDSRPVEWRIGYCHFADQYYLAEIG
jgi:GntR family transcriptional regulator